MPTFSFKNVSALLWVSGSVWMLWKLKLLILLLEEKFYPLAMVLYHILIAGILGFILMLICTKFKTTINKYIQDLYSSEERYCMIFDNSPVGIVHFDQNGTIIHSNKKFIEIVDSTREKVIGCNMLTDLKQPEIIAVVKSAFAGKIDSCEVGYTIANGKTINLKVVINRIISDAGEFLGGVAIFEDITEKKHIETEMARLDRLDLVGQMSASIGHEIRNPMTTVRGFLQLLENKEPDSIKREYYDVMINELDRANTIITEFLSLAKNKLIKVERVSINDIIDSIYPLILIDALKQDKNLSCKKGDISKIPLDAGEIRQLILNLIRNGLEAMPKGKDLTIRTYTSGDELVLAVQDEGSGIRPDLLDKIGTPFLTTKETGTGLGLAVCYSIADRHHAKIDFKTGSEGTTFFVRFKLRKAQVRNRMAS